MGCGIHLYVERYDNIAKTWVSADKWTEEEYGSEVRYKDLFYSDRNYDVFSILADVRNGVGFAGIPTGEGFTPIALPRGLPDNVSPEVKECSFELAGDGHSHSYFTIQEIMDYDWLQTTTKTGVVSMEAYERWKHYPAAPSAYSDSVVGPNILTVPESELPNEEATHVQVSWNTTYWECAQRFLGELLPKVWKISTDPEKVRIVFWFDN